MVHIQKYALYKMLDVVYMVYMIYVCVIYVYTLDMYVSTAVTYVTEHYLCKLVSK